MLTIAEIKVRLDNIQREIEDAAAVSRRSADDVALIAVTKTHPASVIEMAFAAGVRHFGENRVEEFSEKVSQIGEACRSASTWHMIGAVQSRKTNDASVLFDTVHSIDHLKTARRLSAGALKEDKVLNLILQVNVSGESNKSGYKLESWPEDQATFEAMCRDVEAMSHLPAVTIRGLMTMAPFDSEPESTRLIFSKTRELSQVLTSVFPAQDWTGLSMGMSNDYVIAIEEGATFVRLGTALFGLRR